MISDSDEAWFVVERLGVLSQYFMASRPRHPLMWLLVQHTILRLLTLPDVESMYAPSITGPGALKVAFMEYNGVPPGSDAARHPDHKISFQRVKKGLYRGWQNTTVTVVGDKQNAGQYIRRGVVGRKGKKYEEMGMTHFSQTQAKKPKNESCVFRVYHSMRGQEKEEGIGQREVDQANATSVKRVTQ